MLNVGLISTPNLLSSCSNRSWAETIALSMFLFFLVIFSLSSFDFVWFCMLGVILDVIWPVNFCRLWGYAGDQV